MLFRVRMRALRTRGSGKPISLSCSTNAGFGSECLGERIISLVVCTFITGSSTASIGAGVGASCLCVEACEHVENVVQLLLEAFDAAVYCRGLQRAEELGRAHSTDIDAF